MLGFAVRFTGQLQRGKDRMGRAASDLANFGFAHFWIRPAVVASGPRLDGMTAKSALT